MISRSKITKIQRFNLKELEEIHVRIMDSSDSLVIKLWENIFHTISCEITYRFDMVRLHNVSINELDDLVLYILNRGKHYTLKGIRPFKTRKTDNEKLEIVKEKLK